MLFSWNSQISYIPFRNISNEVNSITGYNWLGKEQPVYQPQVTEDRMWGDDRLSHYKNVSILNKRLRIYIYSYLHPSFERAHNP